MVALRLSFGSKSIMLIANEDDSISVVGDQEMHEVALHESRDIGHSLPWAKVIQRPMLWAWVLINQQGYFDGVQMEFAETCDSTRTRIQLLVEASAFKVFC